MQRAVQVWVRPAPHELRVPLLQRAPQAGATSSWPLTGIVPIHYPTCCTPSEPNFCTCLAPHY